MDNGDSTGGFSLRQPSPAQKIIKDNSDQFAIAKHNGREAEFLEGYEDIRFTFDCEATKLRGDVFSYGYIVTAKAKNMRPGLMPDQMVILETGRADTLEPLLGNEPINPYLLRYVLPHSEMAPAFFNLDALHAHENEWKEFSFSKADDPQCKAFLEFMQKHGILKDSIDQDAGKHAQYYVPTSHDLRKRFYDAMQYWQTKGAKFQVDYPVSVESPFLGSIVEDPKIPCDEHDMPFPIRDVLSIMWYEQQAEKPQKRDEWLRQKAMSLMPNLEEHPLHDPLVDATIAACALYDYEGRHPELLKSTELALRL